MKPRSIPTADDTVIHHVQIADGICRLSLFSWARANGLKYVGVTRSFHRLMLRIPSLSEAGFRGAIVRRLSTDTNESTNNGLFWFVIKHEPSPLIKPREGACRSHANRAKQGKLQRLASSL